MHPNYRIHRSTVIVSLFQTQVTKWNTYVWSRENRDQNPILVKFITVLNDHVSTANKIEIVTLQKIHDNLLAETIANATLVGFPVFFHICWITPEKVIEQSIIRHVSGTSDASDIVHVRQTRGKTAVDTEDFPSNDGSDGETVEGVNEGLPDLDVATALTLIIEPIHTGDVGAFVVASQEEEVLWVLELIAKKK